MIYKVLCSCLGLWVVTSSAFVLPGERIAARTPSASVLQLSSEANSVGVSNTREVVTKVAVTGATGATGRFVVEELVSRGVPCVVALVRDIEKVKKVFPNEPDNVEFIQCDLTDEKQIASALKDCDAAIWCASGVSGNSSPIQKAKAFLDISLKRTIETVGLPIFGNFFENVSKESKLPKVVMLSSAGVTRPSWDEEKKEMFPGAADIPIVRLNPFGILDLKRESEELLRQTGVNYCVVRPGGLSGEDKWPSGSRPIFSQGDVAVGRVTRQDVAKVLVDVLSSCEATGKTFEMISAAGYPPALSIDAALSRLVTDKEGPLPLESVRATYTVMQQFLPGETQESASLKMGQTYEQLDKGEDRNRDGVIDAVVGEQAPFFQSR